MIVEERRQINKDIYHFWEELNLAQKFSVAELQRFGYELLFVRRMGPQVLLAVMKAGKKLASIDNNGQIDTTPSVKLREALH